jgi:hypothetical protein
MSTTRMLEKGLVIALALAWGATLGAARVAAEPDRHDRKKERDRTRNEVVVRREPAPHVQVHVRTRAPEPRREPVCAPTRPVRRHVVVRPAPSPPRFTVQVCRAPVPPTHRGHVYYDPYCHERFTSLTLYVSHLRRHPHISFAWVMEIGRSRPLYGCEYEGDRWVRWDSHDD